MAVASFSTLHLSDFSGGWNPYDAWSQVEDNELIDASNFSLDRTGSLVKRLGLTKVNGSDQIVNTGNVQILFYSQVLDSHFAQVGTELYKSTDGGVNWSASIKTFTTSATCGMCDFLGALVVIHPADNAWSYNGTTFTGPIANSPDGNAIVPWQNHLLSIGDPADPNRVTRSDPGAITWPASPVTNNIRVKDDTAITAIGGGEGMDTEGRAGVLVFKENSSYRIHDIATLAYTVVDYNYGASGPLCVTTNNGLTGAISKRGVIVMRGDATEPRLASHKLAPLFLAANLSHANAATMCAGQYEDRMLFSLPWDGSSVNNLTLEYDILHESIVPHSFGVTAMTTYTKNTRKLHAGKVGTAAGSFGYILDVFTGGSDDGTAIACRAQSKWFQLNRGSTTRYRRAVVSGRGSFTLHVKHDFDTGVGETFPISITGTGAVWGTATWGVDTWASTLQQDFAEIFSLGRGRAISFEIAETSSLTHTGDPLLDVGAAPTEGAVALHGIDLDFIPLGRS